MNSDPNQNNKLLNRRNILIGLGSIGIVTGTGLYYTTTKKNHKPLTENRSIQLIRLAYPVHEKNQLITIAQEKGFFQNQNLEIIPVPNIKNKSEIFNLLQTNQCDIAILSILDWLPQFLSPSSINAKLFIGLNGSDFRLLVTRKQKIERLMDLEGLSIGIQPNSEKEKLFFSILLRRKGINPNLNIKWIEMEKDELLPALLSNQIQALIGFDPFIWKILNHNSKRIFELAGSQTASWSRRINQVIGVSNHFMQNNPTLIKPLITALRNASTWQTKHLQEASQILSRQWQQIETKDILTMFKNENQNLTLTGNQLWEQVAQYIDEFKLLNQIPNHLKSGQIAKQFCLSL